MMKINFPLLDNPIDLEKGTILVVEDTQVFADLVKKCYQYTEESELRLFDDKGKSVKMTELMLVTDILGYELNNASILKLVHADLESQFNDKPEVKSTIEQVTGQITDLIAFECLENELNLEYDEITIMELIKALGVKIEAVSDSIFEKFFEILRVFKYLSKKRLLIFVNSLSYLTAEELSQVKEYIDLSATPVLFLEPRKIPDFPQYVLDRDYVLMCENMV